MTARWPAAMEEARPFSVPQLASRWGCSDGLIYKLIRSNRLQSFRLGALIRISAAEVERFECQTTACSGSGEGSPSFTGTKEGECEGNSPRKIGRAPRRKPEGSGKPGTVLPGPWGG